jgi:RimJ/RimL family protein N-acetyltransferase
MAVTIRVWRQEDVENLALYANNVNIWNNMRNYFPHPYGKEQAIDWVKKAMDEVPLVNFAIDLDGEAVGGIGLVLNTDIYLYSAEIAYWLAEPFWGKGITSEAVRQMVEYVYYYFDIVRLYAEVFETNKSSMRVLEKNGFVEFKLSRTGGDWSIEKFDENPEKPRFVLYTGKESA